ncbi:MAG: DUF5615 family PIN-like protein [Nanoarchaeota archaeon]|nr:DUF5615 family PIN-like protein [Nanoarchaeota archaeon]
MKFLVDENLPLSTIALLTELGFEAEDVCAVGLHGASDKRIAEYAKQQKAILITRDLEFGSLLLYPKGSHYGLIVLRMPCFFKIEQIKWLLKSFLTAIRPAQLIHTLSIVEVGKYRQRKLV